MVHARLPSGEQHQQLLVEEERIAELGGFRLDLKTGDAVWSEGLYRVYGIEPGAVAPGVEMVLERTHPDDRERVRALLAMVVERPRTIPVEGVTSEFRALHGDGSVRDFRFRGRIEYDGDGEPAAWFGAVQDVTSQRLTE